MDLEEFDKIIAMKAEIDKIKKEIDVLNKDRNENMDDLDKLDDAYYTHTQMYYINREIERIDKDIELKNEELSKFQPVVDNYRIHINKNQAELYGQYYANKEILAHIEDEMQELDSQIEDEICKYAELYYSFDDTFNLENMDKDLITSYTSDNSEVYRDLIMKHADAEKRYASVEKVIAFTKYNIDKVNQIEYTVFDDVTPVENIAKEIKSKAVSALKFELKDEPKNNYENIEGCLKDVCNELCRKK